MLKAGGEPDLAQNPLRNVLQRAHDFSPTGTLPILGVRPTRSSRRASDPPPGSTSIFFHLFASSEGSSTLHCFPTGDYNGPSGSGESWFEPRRGNEARQRLRSCRASPICGVCFRVRRGGCSCAARRLQAAARLIRPSPAREPHSRKRSRQEVAGAARDRQLEPEGPPDATAPGPA